MAADPRFFASAGPQPLQAVLAATAAATEGERGQGLVLTGIAPLGEAGATDLSYCAGARHRAALRTTRAGAVLVQPALREAVPAGTLALISAAPALAFARAAILFHPPARPSGGVHPTAVLGAGVVLGADVEIGPLAVVGAGARIGAASIIGPHAVVGPGVDLGPGCHIHAHASISHAICGAGVVLHPGARVGQEGFGFVPDAEGAFVTMPQLGLVRLGDGVQIGANACVDRGALGDTVIGPGTRLDNLVQIGHNVRTGRGCVLVAQSGISGSTTLGDFVTLGGQAGLTGHLTIGNGARLGAQTGAMRDVPAGAELIGSPAMPARTAMRAFAALARLGESGKRGGRKDDG